MNPSWFTERAMVVLWARAAATANRQPSPNNAFRSFDD
jgi:hypothetical protein